MSDLCVCVCMCFCLFVNTVKVLFQVFLFTNYILIGRFKGFLVHINGLDCAPNVSFFFIEAATGGVKITQYSQKNTCVGFTF